jgi:cellobiose phosphorylase
LGEAKTAVDLYNLINPIYRADSPTKAQNYKVEPYVISADVYGVSPHEGRGGWTWYTGSSGWMYRLGIEGILGVRRKNKCLHIQPRLPDEWPGYQLTYRSGGATYRITVERQGVGNNVCQVLMDGEPVPDALILLAEDGRLHEVHILLGEEAT